MTTVSILQNHVFHCVAVSSFPWLPFYEIMRFAHACKFYKLFQFKDSGGLDTLLSGKTTDVQRIDVNERITTLERLNPTPRPTT